MTREEIKTSVSDLKEILDYTQLHLDICKIKELMFCDEDRQYVEELSYVCVNKRRKKFSYVIKGYHTWKEVHYDDGTGERHIMNRKALVRVDNDWLYPYDALPRLDYQSVSLPQTPAQKTPGS
jgi:hypothetical protein